LKAFLAPDPSNPLYINVPVLFQKGMNAAIPKAGMLVSQSPNFGSEALLVNASWLVQMATAHAC
jgi:hypothetical protein